MIARRRNLSESVTVATTHCLVLVAALALTACVDEPVQWGDVSYRHSQLGDPPAVSAVMDANLPPIAGTVAPCRHSVTAATGAELYRAWWAVRSDSNAVLSMQRSKDRGHSWELPVEVDARDRGRRGCTRPSPGVSADSASRYVYIAYFLDAEDGPGVFFAHSMDDGRMFHSPVPVVYGRNPARASVAGHGDSVVVVFEDPNATTPRLGIVLSHTTGHIFDQRGEVIPEEVRAVLPWVSLSNDRVAVWWMTPDALDRVGHREGIWK
ncbi:MAG TPA: hypothetical protein VGN73_05890 [Gemmatimonadaceae bacterium]|jgi:hypothetical protein|nr:hypothetical protein [Gemmatimonadaceae bacterium]